MIELNCHSSTSYDEIVDFIKSNKGKNVHFHYELKGYDSWGNDEVLESVIDENFINWLEEYMGSKYEYRNNSAYVHAIKIH